MKEVDGDADVAVKNKKALSPDEHFRDAPDPYKLWGAKLIKRI